MEEVMRLWEAGCLVFLSLPAARAGDAAEPKRFHGRTFLEWQHLLKSNDAAERSRAATALGLGGFGRPAVLPLMQALTDPCDQVQWQACSALWHIGPEAIEAVLALLPWSRKLGD